VPPHATLPPYRSPDELAADLLVVERSLASHGAAALARAKVEPVRRAVQLLGFHLCSLDLRQHSGVHEQVVAELLAGAGVTDRYTSLSEEERVALLVSELRSPRLLRGPFTELSELAEGEQACCVGLRRTWPASALAPSPITSSPRPRASATCSRWRCS
jgi:phosphoenolpyruvate carboxylase